MKTGFEVLKADGSCEEYLHTKIMATISNALASAGDGDIEKAAELAEVVTYHLYNNNHKSNHRCSRHIISSDEIFSIIKATLTAVGCEDAAIALEEHHYRRKLGRSRIEVVDIDIDDLEDIDIFFNDNGQGASRWDKSRIAIYLENKYGLDRMSARAVAAMVEQKVFTLGFTRLSAGLVKQLVLNEMEIMKRAMRRLQAQPKVESHTSGG